MTTYTTYEDFAEAFDFDNYDSDLYREFNDEFSYSDYEFALDKASLGDIKWNYSQLLEELYNIALRFVCEHLAIDYRTAPEAIKKAVKADYQFMYDEYEMFDYSTFEAKALLRR